MKLKRNSNCVIIYKLIMLMLSKNIDVIVMSLKYAFCMFAYFTLSHQFALGIATKMILYIMKLQSFTLCINGGKIDNSMFVKQYIALILSIGHLFGQQRFHSSKQNAVMLVLCQKN